MSSFDTFARPAPKSVNGPPGAGTSKSTADADRGQAWPTRRKLAYALVALLAVVLLATIAAMFTDIDLQRIKDVASLAIAPVAGLVGAVVGFYFGARVGTATADGAGGKPEDSGTLSRDRLYRSTGSTPLCGGIRLSSPSSPGVFIVGAVGGARP